MSLSSTIMGLPKNTFQNYLVTIMWELKIIEIFFCLIVENSPLFVLILKVIIIKYMKIQ